MKFITHYTLQAKESILVMFNHTFSVPNKCIVYTISVSNAMLFWINLSTYEMHYTFPSDLGDNFHKGWQEQTVAGGEGVSLCLCPGPWHETSPAVDLRREEYVRPPVEVWRLDARSSLSGGEGSVEEGKSRDNFGGN